MGRASLQIFWLLRTMAYDQKRKADNSKLIITLLQACQQAATAPKVPASPRRKSALERRTDTFQLPDAPQLSSLRRHTTTVVIPSAGPCEGLSQISHSPSSTRESTPAARQPSGEPPSGAGEQQQRLSSLHEELGGTGEGVTELVRASLSDLSHGGTGIVATTGPSESPQRDVQGAAECFAATVDFFDLLCDGSSSLAPQPQPKRQSALRSRLEGINERLHEPDLLGKVRKPFFSLELLASLLCQLRVRAMRDIVGASDDKIKTSIYPTGMSDSYACLRPLPRINPCPPCSCRAAAALQA